MTRDYAKRSTKQSREKPKSGIHGWQWFTLGFAAGVLATLVGWLWLMRTDSAPPQAAATPPPAEAEAQAEQMQWDFYDLLRKMEVKAIPDYLTTQDDSANYLWIIQAGSFRDQSRADQVRGELILLGLAAEVQTQTVEGKKWHRVVAGPFDTRLEMNRAQDKMADARIESNPVRLRREEP